MSIFRRYMGLSHLTVGFRHFLQRGIALVGSASHSAAQTLSQMIVIHAAFHGAGQVVPAATMLTLICIQLALSSRDCFVWTMSYTTSRRTRRTTIPRHVCIGRINA